MVVDDHVAELTFTVVAVSKTPEATNVPVLVAPIRPTMESDDYPIRGLDCTSHHLPGRIAMPELYTNAPRGFPDVILSDHRFEVLTIKQYLLSQSDEESYLAGELNIEEDDDMEEEEEEEDEEDDMGALIDDEDDDNDDNVVERFV